MVELRLIDELARRGSLSLAAEALDMNLSAASRLLAKIERDLGFQVLDRSTRPAQLTSEAKTLLTFVRRIVHQHAAMTDRVRSMRAVPRSFERVIRLSLPINSDRSMYLGVADRFAARHKGVGVEVLADVGLDGLSSGRADLGFFGYRPDTSEFVTMPVKPDVSFLMVSRDYAAYHGLPKTIEELGQHIVLVRHSGNPSSVKCLERGHERVELAVNQPVRQGDADFCRTMMLAGQGIALDLSLPFLKDELEDGRVVPVLPGWHRPVWESAFVLPIRHEKDSLIRELMAMLVAEHNAKCEGVWKHWYRRFDIPFSSVVFPSASR